MYTERYEVKTYFTQAKCDKCRIGFLNFTGIIKLSDPEFTDPDLYEHVCNNCKRVEDLLKAYPYTETKKYFG